MNRLNEKKILETGKDLVQKNGFDGMSFKDISKLVDIKTSSIHYYFPTKNDLAIALMKQEIEALETFFKKLENASCSEKIQDIHLQTELPYKKPKNGELEEDEKDYNKALSRIRVKAENVLAQIKTFKILADRYRNKRKRYNLKFNIRPSA